jgi:hypothetical protein
MKYKSFLLACFFVLALCFVVVGILALLGYQNAEIYFWTRSPIESDAGKMIWIAISAICLITFFVLSVIEYRKKNN